MTDLKADGPAKVNGAAVKFARDAVNEVDWVALDAELARADADDLAGRP
jgi:hypothetical protein